MSSMVSSDIDDPQRFWPYYFVLEETPPGVMPWLSPGPIARQALAAMRKPFRAWETGLFFEVTDYYYELARERRLKPVERAIRDVGDRLEWRVERVSAHDGVYMSASGKTESAKLIGGRHINPRCLDDYVDRSSELMRSIGLDGYRSDWQLGGDPETAAVYQEALDWAQAGVVVLQQSLAWPFTGILPWSQHDNRPAHRVVFQYALVLGLTSLRKAKPWFRAALYFDPTDHFGASDFL